MNSKLMYIMTIGCQMNVYDSGQIRGVLFLNEYSETTILEDADLVIVNTCAIRQKAEQKAFSFLGKTIKLKKRKPSLIIAIGGCVAQQYAENILKRMPSVDLVFGTNAISRLPELISRIESFRCKIVDVNIPIPRKDKDIFFTNHHNNSKVSSFVTIMKGCENFCTYCVVPYVRGKEVSRESRHIIKEVEMLVSLGVKEIVLLGQNVNSYGLRDKSDGFVQLLKRINNVAGLERIRFTTSNPKDLSEDLIDAFCSIEKLCSHIHLPVQSGNNTILRRMNRRYTREYYIDKVFELRKKCPGIAITSDFIVGFPGESDQQFEATLDLINLIRFDSLFAFSYSDRPSTIASNFTNKISKKIKQFRLQRLLKLQSSISLDINKSMVGNLEQVLVEGSSFDNNFNRSYKNNVSNNSYSFYHCVGRTSTNRIVHFSSNRNEDFENLEGSLVNVRIIEAKAHSLRAKVSTI